MSSSSSAGAVLMPSNARLRAWVEDAALAPSSHNTQPWLFRIAATSVDLLADRTRALPVNDPEDRELTISCGCALLNLRAAAAADGCGVRTTLLPDVEDHDLLARLHVAKVPPDAQLAPLRPVIAARRTCREPLSLGADDDAIMQALTDAAAAEDVRLHVLQGQVERHAAADLVAEGDALQWADPRWRRELAMWMHPRRRGDGLSMPALAVPVAQLIVRSFDMGKQVAAKDRQVADGSPVLAVLTTQGDSVQDWLRAGQALQRVLLVAAARGWQASYLNQPVQAAALRPRLQTLAGCAGQVQLLLRLGRPLRPVAPAPRRPVNDLILEPPT